VIPGVQVWRFEPPLVPTPDDARSALRHELARPDYHDTNLLQRLLDWVQQRIEDGVNAASTSSPLVTLAAMVALLGVVAFVVWLISRTRRSPRGAAREGGVLTDEAVTAAELRRRAERARAEGRPEDAVVDGFRALALRQVERGRLHDQPGATAHEVAASIEATYPTHSERVDQAAALFEAVLYGGHGASGEQADALLRLDDDLAAVR
jgi:hypothetical protein